MAHERRHGGKGGSGKGVSAWTGCSRKAPMQQCSLLTLPSALFSTHMPQGLSSMAKSLTPHRSSTQIFFILGLWCPSTIPTFLISPPMHSARHPGVPLREMLLPARSWRSSRLAPCALSARPVHPHEVTCHWFSYTLFLQGQLSLT